MPTKFKYCPHCQAPLEDDGTCPGCTYGHKRNQPAGAKPMNPECPWNDHGIKCTNIGSLSDSNNGGGPWYCATHFWQLKGWPVKQSDAPQTSYRERWYEEKEILYEPPNFDDAGWLRCVSKDAKALSLKLHRGAIGPVKPRQREPGDDDDEVAA